LRTIFVDTGHWIATLNPRDELHERALAVSKALGKVRLVTSEMVLVELLNDFARRGEALRAAAVTLVERLRANPNVLIVAQTSLQFRDALTLYRERPDQSWSLTDCASCLIMREQGIQEALAHDKHFEQMGFKALLRDERDD